MAAGGPLKEGALLGERYVLGAQIGLGGTGAVFSAVDQHTGVKVAVKVLRRALAEDSVSLTRFHREMNAMATLRHPNVVPLLDHGFVAGVLPFIVMPWLKGPTLWVRLRRKGPMPVDDVQKLLFPLCSALAAVHRAGMLHRDIKSANIILTPTQGPQLLDLGLVHEDEITALTAPGHACGTPEYMAPERIVGTGESDYRSDLYSLGVLVFEMLTATLPYTSSKRLDILRAQVRSPVPDPSKLVRELSRSVSRCTMRFMAKDPAKRPVTALALARDFEAAAAGSGAWAAVRERYIKPMPQGRVVVLGADGRAWDELPALFELYDVEAFRADEPDAARALLEASPRAVLWCASPFPVETLVDLLESLRAMPAHVVLADSEGVEILSGAGVYALYCPEGLPLAEVLRTARAIFGHMRKSD